METTKYKTDKGILIEEVDLWQENPRELYESPTNFFTWLHRSCSPDENGYRNAQEFIEAMLPAGWKKIDALYREGKFGEGNEILAKKMENKGIILLPVWKFEHGSVSYQASAENPFSCPFDSCMAGYIFAEKKKLQEALGIKPGSRGQREKMEKFLEEEVRVYTAYVNGEVYGYRLEDSDGKTIWPEEQDPEDPAVPQLDWGYYGDVYENGIQKNLGITELAPC